MITICTRTTCEYFRSYTYCAAEVCPFPTEQSTTGSIWNIKQPITNADRIRAMTDEEMADFIGNYTCPPSYNDSGGCERSECCEDCWLNWLKQEVKE